MFASSSSSPLVCIGWTLIHSLWQGVFVWAMYRLARSTIRDAAMRVHLGHAALLIFVIVQAPTFAHLMGAAGTTIAPIADMTFVRLAEFDANARKLPLPELAPTVRLGTWIAARERYMPLVVMAWGIGLLLQVVRTLGAYYLLQRHVNACGELDASLRAKFEGLAVRIGLKRAVRFLESSLVSTPATARWLKPVVLVPTATMLQMSPHHLEALILHELVHIKRWDYATNILRTFVSALYFFHPLIRDVCGRTADDAEVATDAIAAAAFGDEKIYAESLVALADLRRSMPLSMSAGGGDLRSRILRLLRQQSLPAVSVRSRASLGGTLLSGVVGMLLLASATAWATQGRDTMNRLTHRSFEEIVVESLSRNAPNEAFIAPMTRAMDEMRAGRLVTAQTAKELTDALLDGVDPHVLYRRVCAVPGRVDFDVVRTYPFGPFGDSNDRRVLADELVRHAQRAADPAEAARIARATLVFASLMVPADSGRVATLLLQDRAFIVMLRLSHDDYRLLQLMAAVNNDRLARVGKILASDRSSPRGATDAEIEEFAAELPYLPAFQLTLCTKMSKRFQSRVLGVLHRDLALYPPGSVQFAIEHAARDEAPAR